MVSNYQHNRQCTCNLRWIILCPSKVKPALSSTVLSGHHLLSSLLSKTQYCYSLNYVTVIFTSVYNKQSPLLRCCGHLLLSPNTFLNCPLPVLDGYSMWNHTYKTNLSSKTWSIFYLPREFLYIAKTGYFFYVFKNTPILWSLCYSLWVTA